MPSLLDKAPTLTRVLLALSEETRSTIVSELVAINDEGRADAFECAIDITTKWRKLSDIRWEFGVRADAARRKR